MHRNGDSCCAICLAPTSLKEPHSSIPWRTSQSSVMQCTFLCLYWTEQIGLWMLSHWTCKIRTWIYFDPDFSGCRLYLNLDTSKFLPPLKKLWVDSIVRIKDWWPIKWHFPGRARENHGTPQSGQSVSSPTFQKGTYKGFRLLGCDAVGSCKNRRFGRMYCLRRQFSDFSPWLWRLYDPPKRRFLQERATRRHIPEDNVLHSHRRENFRSYK
jgi:hypothetical protein